MKRKRSLILESTINAGQKSSNLAAMSNSPRRAGAVSLSKSCDRNNISPRVSFEERTTKKRWISYHQASALYEDDGDEECCNPALNQPALDPQRKHHFLMLFCGDLRSSLRACLSADSSFEVMRRQDCGDSSDVFLSTDSLLGPENARLM